MRSPRLCACPLARRCADPWLVAGAGGYPSMVNLLAEWLNVSAGAAAPSAAGGQEGQRADPVMMARLQIKLQESFDPAHADASFNTTGSFWLSVIVNRIDDVRLPFRACAWHGRGISGRYWMRLPGATSGVIAHDTCPPPDPLAS